MEVELKLRIREDMLPGLRDRLHRLGARAEGARTQQDVFFQHPCRDLVATDEAFRWRQEDGGHELTYKGPREQADAKARPEFNLGVQGDPTALLMALGFEPAARLSKTREPWTLPDAEVGLDHVEGVGWFVEIEALSDADPHGLVEALRVRLGLADAAALTDSYLALALAAGASAADVL